MRGFLSVLTIASSLALLGPASASVTYNFTGGTLFPISDFSISEFPVLDSFKYTAPSFITTYTVIDGDAAGCTVFFATCNSVEFNPTATGDIITINYSSQLVPLAAKVAAFDPFSDSDTFTFAAGTFGQTGGPFLSQDENGGALTISETTLSSVPLPASAPMFGAALLGLASLGFVAKRTKATAAA